MKIIRFKDLEFIPASHEDPKNPGALKKILFKKEGLDPGRIQMVNWAKIPLGKAFESHYHEDMFEVFIIMSGRAKVEINNEEAVLETGDTVVVSEKQVHKMTNIGLEDVEYIVMGVSREEGGKTVNV